MQNEFKINRSFKAPKELLFKVWTQPEHLANWWGPSGFKIEVKELTLKVGGLFHYKMAAANGDTSWGKFVYKEITPFDKLVFVTSFSDEKANSIKPEMLPDFPLEILNTIIFTEENGETTLNMTGVAHNANAAETETFIKMFGGLNVGWNGTFVQLENYLATL